MRYNREWTTQDELAFIAGLGTWSPAVEGTTHLGLLKGYRRALKFRHEWGEMDKAVIGAALDRQIARLEHGTS